jgi:hypothetical protein
MTIEEIRASDKAFLTPQDISRALGSDPQTIRLTAKLHPERIGYPFTFVGTRMKIPRIGFLRWYDN